MNEMKIFENSQFGEIRACERNYEPWFVGKDVAEALGYCDVNKAVAMHVDEEDKLNDKTSSSLGQRGGWIINESGLYSLIFSSKLESAKAFKRWVTSEVLPSIRRTGRYDMPWRHTESLHDMAQPMVIHASGRVTVTVTPKSDGEGHSSADVTVDVQPSRLGIAGKQESANTFFQSMLCTSYGNRIPSFELYDAYCLWCEENRHAVLNFTWFGKRLHDCFPEAYKARSWVSGTSRQNFYYNLDYINK